MNLKPELRECYAARIHNLFNGAVQASPDAINDEVVRVVDTMFNEITTCHRNLAIFALPAQLIAQAMDALIPDELKLLVGSKTLEEYLKDKSENTVLALFRLAKANEYFNFMKEMQEVWLEYTSSNRRLVLCINNAKRNYRSALEIALLDI